LRTEGRLEDEDLPDIVQDLSRRRWTGVLRLVRKDERIGITFESGHLVFAASSNPDYRLGPRLLRRGVISLAQMERATRAKPHEKRFGTVLVEMGYLDSKELVRGVVGQTRDIILLAFQWTEGAFRLEGPAPGETITLDMSTPQLILDGPPRSRRGAAWSGARAASPRATPASRAPTASSSSSRSTSTRPPSCARSTASGTSSPSSKRRC
jgi:hypothetical protein